MSFASPYLFLSSLPWTAFGAPIYSGTVGCPRNGPLQKRSSSWWNHTSELPVHYGNYAPILRIAGESVPSWLSWPTSSGRLGSSQLGSCSYSTAGWWSTWSSFRCSSFPSPSHWSTPRRRSINNACLNANHNGNRWPEIESPLRFKADISCQPCNLISRHWKNWSLPTYSASYRWVLLGSHLPSMGRQIFDGWGLLVIVVTISYNRWYITFLSL